MPKYGKSPSIKLGLVLAVLVVLAYGFLLMVVRVSWVAVVVLTAGALLLIASQFVDSRLKRRMRRNFGEADWAYVESWFYPTGWLWACACYLAGALINVSTAPRSHDQQIINNGPTDKTPQR